jgi:hypothetical protein
MEIICFLYFHLGPSAMIMNTHNLCHLAKQVQDHGPLWSNSMFPFENMIKEIGYLHCGTRNIGDQVIEKFHHRQELARCQHTSSEVIDKFTVQLRLRRNRYVRDNTVTITDDVKYFLPMPQDLLQIEEWEAIMRFCGVDVIQCATPARAIVNHEVYHSAMYKRKGSSCSNLVEAVGNNHTVYGRIVKFILHQSSPIALLKVMHPHDLNICKETSRPSQPFLGKLVSDCQLANFYLPVEELDELIAVDCTAIRRKCLFIDAPNFHESVSGFVVPILRDFKV